MLAPEQRRLAIAMAILIGAVAGCERAAVPTVEIASAPANLTAANATSPSAPAAAQPAPTPEADAADDDDNRVVTKSFDDIKFDIEPDAPYDRSMLTDAIEALVGRRIRIRGFMLPTARQRGLREFVLMRDNMECCFGPGAALYDCILVEMREGQTTDLTLYSVAVEGEFTVEEFLGPDGKPLRHLPHARRNGGALRKIGPLTGFGKCWSHLTQLAVSRFYLGISPSIASFPRIAFCCLRSV